LQNGISCDAIGCIGRLSDGRLISFAQSLEALAEDCKRAAVVVSPREAKLSCAAILVDRRVWRGKGAIALRWTGARFEESAARPVGLDRPWARGPQSELVAVPVAPPPGALDATPRKEDMEAGD